MKKVFCLACLLMALALLPALAMAQEAAAMPEVAASIDWTALVVAVIGVIGTALSALLGRVWVKYVKPWLEQRDLTDAAKLWWRPWRRCWGVTAERTSGNWLWKRWQSGDFTLTASR